jgi:uncharacterized protein YcfJ
MMTAFVESSPTRAQRLVTRLIVLSIGVLLSLPGAVTAQVAVAQSQVAQTSASRVLISGVTQKKNDEVHQSATAVPKARRNRLIVAGSVLGAIAGGYIGHQQERHRLCVASPSANCPTLEHNTLKIGVLGAVLGGATGFLVNRL